jgi:hypothetical protein
VGRDDTSLCDSAAVGEVPSVDEVELAVREPLVKELGGDRSAASRSVVAGSG